jgi:hypothetical protein
VIELILEYHDAINKDCKKEEDTGRKAEALAWRT